MSKARSHPVLDNPKLAWLHDDNIRPYVFVRPENRIPSPGELHKGVDWFSHKVIYKNPMEMKEVHFANQILNLEAKAFGPSNMAMPRWVFYDCAIVPGFVAGFAAKRSHLDPKILQMIQNNSETGPPAETSDEQEEWVPLSLFIIIPTMSRQGEWVAHNLCSVNSLLPKELQFYGIGFISKAFGLWYANVQTCCGMTQWQSPSIKLHSNYGDFEILTSYTPVHSYAKTLTYRLRVEPERWSGFFTKQSYSDFRSKYEKSEIWLDPTSEASLKSLQTRLEKGEGPFFLDSQETLIKDLSAPLQIYRLPRPV